MTSDGVVVAISPGAPRKTIDCKKKAILFVVLEGRRRKRIFTFWRRVPSRFSHSGILISHICDPSRELYLVSYKQRRKQRKRVNWVVPFRLFFSFSPYSSVSQSQKDVILHRSCDSERSVSLSSRFVNHAIECLQHLKFFCGMKKIVSSCEKLGIKVSKSISTCSNREKR
jgi:hypothetical protein